MHNEAAKRATPKGGNKAEDVDEPAAVMRPVPRRFTPATPSRKAAAVPTAMVLSDETQRAMPAPGLVSLTAAANTALGTLAHQHKSAWARYQSPSGSSSPPHKAASPPRSGEAAMATQAVAQRVWERVTAAESNTTASATPPPDSPDRAPHSPVLPAANPFGQLAAFSQHLKAHLENQLVSQLAATSMAAGAHDGPRLKAEPGAQPLDSFQAAPVAGPVRRPKAERPNPVNGSLSILPEERPPPREPLPPQLSSQPSSGLAHISRLSQQLEEMLRGQGTAQGPMAQGPMAQGPMAQGPAAQGPAQQLSILTSEPPIYGGAPSSSLPIHGPATPTYSSYPRYNGQESFREPAIYQGNVDLEAQAKLGLTAISNANANAARAIRRWNSVSSLASENSLYTVGCHAAAGPLVSQSSMLSNMSASDSQALMQSLQMLCQANELAAMANSQIQAFSMAANANLEAAAQGIRKRKVSDFYDDAPKRHNSMVSEGEAYSSYNPSAQQICTECGTTSTPTWRRCGKRLMCNACGLRRSRSMKARSNSMPLGASHTPELMQSESQKA